jgi:hypothetical protein
MLMLYFARYRLSRRLRRSQGSRSQPAQNSSPFSCRMEHILIGQAVLVFGLPRFGALQPGHLFLGRRWA